MPNTNLTPINKLTIGKNDNRFVLFTDNWLNLQSYVSATLTLPITKGDFSTKYGDFPEADKKLVTGCIGAMKDVKDLSNSFGDPNAIKSKILNDPNYLGSSTPPDMLYGHMIWLSSQIQNQASTFTNTFSSLKELFTGTREENAKNLKMLLIGQGGLTSTAKTANEQVNALMTKLSAFDSNFSAANEILQNYTGSQSKILAAANKAVADLEALIKKTQGEAKVAHKLWEDLTIAAISVSVGLTILSGGLLLPLAAIAGTALGIAAANALASYNDLCSKITGQQARKKQKSQLVCDLSGLNSMMLIVSPAMNAFKTSLSEIEGVWVNINANLSYIVNNYTVDQLGDLNWVMQAFKLLDAQKKWGAISDSTKLFVEGSLVTYDTKPFGEKIPESQAA